MRLIDADELWNDLGILYAYNKGRVNWNDAIMKIKYAPTVEERKVGEWIVSENPDEGWINLKCPFCGKTMSYYIHTEARPNFCINCGAIMEGEE